VLRSAPTTRASAPLSPSPAPSSLTNHNVYVAPFPTATSHALTRIAADEGTGGGGGSGKTFSEDTVAVLLMALGSVSISSAQYAMMSSLDGTKTASSFQHGFRSVLKKAKELKARVDDGETFAPVAPTPKKRGTCCGAAVSLWKGSVLICAGGAAEGAVPAATPKRSKAIPKGRGKKAKGAEEAAAGKGVDSREVDEDMDLGGRFKKEELADDLI
jgi:hypothetical protein